MSKSRIIGKAAIDVAGFIASAKKRVIIETPELFETMFGKDLGVDVGFYSDGNSFFVRSTRYNSENEHTEALKESREKDIDEAATRLCEVADYLTRFGLSFDYYQNIKVCKTREDLKLWRNESPHNFVEMCVIGYGTSHFAVPVEFCTVEMFENREDVPLGELQNKLGNGIDRDNAVAKKFGPQDHISLRSARIAKEAAEKQVSEIDMQIGAVKRGEHPEIVELHRQMEEAKKKFEEMVAELSGSMVAQKSSLMLDVAEKTHVIDAIDSMLYAVQCFEGEVVDFTCVCDGPSAGIDEPLVIYQSLRYLDEELGRYCSIYNHDFSNISLFEDLLAARSDVVEVFCPNPKSICFIGNSSTRSAYRVIDSVRGIFENYRKLHADTMGILIRNGSKVFFGWTDEERIHIKDGKLFYSVGETLLDAEDVKKNPWDLDGEWTNDMWKLPEWFKKSENVSYDDQKAINYDPNEEQKIRSFENFRQLTAAKILRDTNIRQRVSRVFAFSIIDGVLHRGDMMQLPEEENLREIVQGKPSRYILFSMADAWLPENTYPSFNEYLEKYCSTNKVGDPILVMLGLSDGQYGQYSRRYSYNRSVDGLSRTSDASVEGKTIQSINLIENGDVFISARKEYSMKGARANFRLCSGEYINITFMNSVWLEYVLRTRAVNGVRVNNATFSFGDMLPYIKVAKQWLEGREAATSVHLSAIAPEILKDKHWPIEMSMWMFENNVRLHIVSEYQARRFARHYRARHSDCK